jgi:hypothetical protein
MDIISFKDWILAQESSPFTRRRRAAALGLAPPIPAASVHSHGTAHPFEVEMIIKANKPKKKPNKKRNKKKNK